MNPGKLLLLWLCLLSPLSSTPGLAFGGPTRGGQLRHCQSNQKTLEGAWEMWNLDHDSAAPLDSELVASLVAEGYLMQVPFCPDSRNLARGYVALPDRQEVVCLFHGSRKALVKPGMSAREQLRQYGVLDESTLSQASEVAIIPLGIGDLFAAQPGLHGLLAVVMGMPSLFLWAFLGL